MRKIVPMGLALASLLTLTGCHLDMWYQPKAKPQQESNFFSDKQASRPLVAHTVARSGGKTEDVNPSGNPMHTGNPYFTAEADGKLLDRLPIPVNKETLERGQERFDIFCSPCHGRLGNGKGMIASRGLALRRPPATYHTDRLRKMPIGHFYDVITNGYGVMYSYASRVEPEDRWKIAAYIRVLQFSQNATINDVPEATRQKLLSGQSLEPSGSESEQR